MAQRRALRQHDKSIADLPGFESSQVGFAIGLEKGGSSVASCIFGFTLPSFLIMTVLALTAEQLTGSALAIIYGLKLFAVVIVADAVLGAGKKLCKTTALKVVTFLATLTLLFLPSLSSQLGGLVAIAIAGYFYSFSNAPAEQSATSGNTNWAVLAFSVLFLTPFYSCRIPFSPSFIGWSLSVWRRPWYFHCCRPV